MLVVVVMVAASLVTFLGLGAVLFFRGRKILAEDTAVKPWLGLGRWTPSPPEQQALGWVGMAQPSGISRVIGVAHGDEITNRYRAVRVVTMVMRSAQRYRRVREPT